MKYPLASTDDHSLAAASVWIPISCLRPYDLYPILKMLIHNVFRTILEIILDISLRPTSIPDRSSSLLLQNNCDLCDVYQVAVSVFQEVPEKKVDIGFHSFVENNVSIHPHHQVLP